MKNKTSKPDIIDQKQTFQPRLKGYTLCSSAHESCTTVGHTLYHKASTQNFKICSLMRVSET